MGARLWRLIDNGEELELDALRDREPGRSLRTGVMCSQEVVRVRRQAAEFYVLYKFCMYWSLWRSLDGVPYCYCSNRGLLLSKAVVSAEPVLTEEPLVASLEETSTPATTTHIPNGFSDKCYCIISISSF